MIPYETFPTEARGPLVALICEALWESVERTAAQHPERIDELQEWLDDEAASGLSVKAVISRTADGTPDPNTLTFHADLMTSEGLAPLLRVKAADLRKEDGSPVDVDWTAASLLAQHEDF